jgi:hypothetical protein
MGEIGTGYDQGIAIFENSSGCLSDHFNFLRIVRSDHDRNK